CGHGVHVCRPTELAHWLHDELWEVETSGEELEGIDCIVVRRARLIRRIDAWSEGGAARFAEACAAHAAAVSGPPHPAIVDAFLEDARFWARAGQVAGCAFCAALAVARAVSAEESQLAFRRERAWQAGWIARELISR